VRPRVEHQPPEVEHSRFLRRGRRGWGPGTAHHGLDAGHDLVGRGRLDDVVVRAQAEAAQLIAVSFTGGQEKNWHVGQHAHLAADLEPIGARHHDVQQDAGYRLAAQHRQRLRAIVGGQYAEPLGLEEVAQHLDDGDLVVHDQDGGRARCRARRISGLSHCCSGMSDQPLCIIARRGTMRERKCFPASYCHHPFNTYSSPARGRRSLVGW
jgi:hypothetical protein